MLGDLPPGAAESSLPGRWSVAEIVEHLDLTYTKNAAGLRRRLAKPDASPHPRTFRQTVARFVVVGLGYFPSGRESPKSVLPEGRPFAEVRTKLEGHLIDLDQALHDAERAFGPARPILDHPVIGPFSVADWRRFHWIHTRHHLRQIERRMSRPV